jgi:hypothetical protein
LSGRQQEPGEIVDGHNAGNGCVVEADVGMFLDELHHAQEIEVARFV